MRSAALRKPAAFEEYVPDEDARRDGFIGVGVDPDRRRGRGATVNPAGRFETERRERFDDGWAIEEDAPAIETSVAAEPSRRIITRNDSPDISFDRSINPYRGCEHGCVYCFARPTHSFLGLSPGIDFETKLFAKTNAAGLLERELSAKGYVPRTIAIGTATDPYQPIERRYRITRQILEVLERFGHPAAIVTKSAGVLRDLDILARMAERNLVKVAVSVTSLDRGLSRIMEPRASTPALRLEAIRRLSEAGVPAIAMVAPIIPALNDMEIERILDAARAAGARGAGYVVLRLPHELREIVRAWLLEHRPDALRHVFSLVQDMRGGKEYDARFGGRMSGEGPYAWAIGRRFELAAKRLGLDRRERLTTRHFKPPVVESPQLALF